MHPESRQPSQAAVHVSSEATVLLQAMQDVHLCSHTAYFSVWQDWLCHPGLILGQDTKLPTAEEGRGTTAGAGSEYPIPGTLNCSLDTFRFSNQASKLLRSNLLFVGKPLSGPLMSTTKGASAVTLTSRKPPLKNGGIRTRKYLLL